MDTTTGMYSPQRQGGRGVWPQMAEKTQILVSDRHHRMLGILSGAIHE
jgi:hypothetical protein